MNTNTDITAALCLLRDMFKQEAKDLLEPAEASLIVAKQNYHDAKIKYNQLIKRANDIQSLISIQMQTDLNEKIRLEEQYSFKSNHQMEEQSK